MLDLQQKSLKYICSFDTSKSWLQFLTGLWLGINMFVFVLIFQSVAVFDVSAGTFTIHKELIKLMQGE